MFGGTLRIELSVILLILTVRSYLLFLVLAANTYMNTERVLSGCHTLRVICAHSQKLCDSWRQMAWLPDLGTMLPSSGTSPRTLCPSSAIPLSLYFPCGEAHAQPKLRRRETDDGGDKRGLCEGPPPRSQGNYRWGVWSNDGLMNPTVKDLAVLSSPDTVFLFCPGHYFILRWNDLFSTTGCDWAHASHRNEFQRSSYFTALPWRASSDHCRQMKVQQPTGRSRLNCSNSFQAPLLLSKKRIQVVLSWLGIKDRSWCGNTEQHCNPAYNLGL